MESVLENTVPMQTEQAGVQATMTEIGNRNTSLQGNAIPDNNCNINEKKSIPTKRRLDLCSKSRQRLRSKD